MESNEKKRKIKWIYAKARIEVCQPSPLRPSPPCAHVRRPTQQLRRKNFDMCGINHTANSTCMRCVIGFIFVVSIYWYGIDEMVVVCVWCDVMWCSFHNMGPCDWMRMILCSKICWLPEIFIWILFLCDFSRAFMKILLVASAFAIKCTAHTYDSNNYLSQYIFIHTTTAATTTSTQSIYIWIFSAGLHLVFSLHFLCYIYVTCGGIAWLLSITFAKVINTIERECVWYIQ